MGLCYLMASYKGLPTVLVILFLLIIFYAFVTSQTVIGRRIYAMGGNEKAAAFPASIRHACYFILSSIWVFSPPWQD
jgi:ABC-type xylose transport system permease subunit